MTDTPIEKSEAERKSMAFNTEAARAGIFAAMLDIVDTMRESGIPDVEACVLTGAVEASAQLWAQVGQAAKIPRAKNRKTFEGEARRFFNKHRDAAEAAAAGLPGVTVQ